MYLLAYVQYHWYTFYSYYFLIFIQLFSFLRPGGWNLISEVSEDTSTVATQFINVVTEGFISATLLSRFYCDARYSLVFIFLRITYPTPTLYTKHCSTHPFIATLLGTTQKGT